MDIFTIVVVRNFAVPGVTVSNGWLRSVDVTVSIALAVKYVPLYRVYMSINGVERKKPPGFLIMSRRHVDNVCRIDIPLDAFSMIALFNNDVSALSFLGTYECPGTYRSIIVIIGQMRAPATAALAASAANLSPKLRVFH